MFEANGFIFVAQWHRFSSLGTRLYAFDRCTLTSMYLSAASPTRPTPEYKQIQLWWCYMLDKLAWLIVASLPSEDDLKSRSPDLWLPTSGIAQYTFCLSTAYLPRVVTRSQAANTSTMFRTDGLDLIGIPSLCFGIPEWNFHPDFLQNRSYALHRMIRLAYSRNNSGCTEQSISLDGPLHSGHQYMIANFHRFPVETQTSVWTSRTINVLSLACRQSQLSRQKSNTKQTLDMDGFCNSSEVCSALPILIAAPDRVRMVHSNIFLRQLDQYSRC